MADGYNELYRAHPLLGYRMMADKLRAEKRAQQYEEEDRAYRQQRLQFDMENARANRELAMFQQQAALARQGIVPTLGGTAGKFVAGLGGGTTAELGGKTYAMPTRRSLELENAQQEQEKLDRQFAQTQRIEQFKAGLRGPRQTRTPNLQSDEIVTKGVKYKVWYDPTTGDEVKRTKVGEVDQKVDREDRMSAAEIDAQAHEIALQEAAGADERGAPAGDQDIAAKFEIAKATGDVETASSMMRVLQSAGWEVGGNPEDGSGYIKPPKRRVEDTQAYKSALIRAKARLSREAREGGGSAIQQAFTPRTTRTPAQKEQKAAQVEAEYLSNYARMSPQERSEFEKEFQRIYKRPVNRPITGS